MTFKLYIPFILHLHVKSPLIYNIISKSYSKKVAQRDKIRLKMILEK